MAGRRPAASARLPRVIDIPASKRPSVPSEAEPTTSVAPNDENGTPPNLSSLPDEPLTVIEPSRTWAPLKWSDLWAYRELLFFLVWRDIKVRYKQTALGAAWAVLQPVFMTLIFTLLFGRLAGLNKGSDIPYPLFALAGLVPWTSFANVVSTSSNSVVNNASLITKVYFPRIIVPTAAVAAGSVDFGLAFAVLIGLVFYYGVMPTAAAAMLPVLAVMTFLFALGIGTWLSALNVKYRDVRFVLPFIIQLGLFVSSVIIPSSALPGAWRRVLILNPMSAIVEGYRSALFGQPFDWPALAAAAVIISGMLVYSVYFFRRVEKGFADII